MHAAPTMTDRELYSLLTRVRAGDMAAFEQIYHAMKSPVYTVALRILGDTGLSEDVVQEVFVKLYRQPPLPDVHQPRAYLFRMARNSALDTLRRRAVRRAAVSLDDPTCGIGDTLSDPAAADGGVGLRWDLERAMASLSETERQIVTLHVNAGLKFREIAAVMEMPLGTVLGQYNRALSRLRRLLSPE